MRSRAQLVTHGTLADLNEKGVDVGQGPRVAATPDSSVMCVRAQAIRKLPPMSIPVVERVFRPTAPPGAVAERS